MRVAVTGTSGRLGGALVAALSGAPISGPGGPIGWSRPEFDLDLPGSAIALLRRDRPDVVIHAAAWTDVDGCAKEPALAMHRNGEATGLLARACAAAGVDLVLISTNEVFDGARTDRRGYRPEDPTGPQNAYGTSKLAGERAASEAFATGVRGGATLGIIRTAWLFGPPGSDYPHRIVAAALRAREAGRPLQVVVDEVGSPTYAPDLAAAIVELLKAGASAGVRHIVNGGTSSRAEWAKETLRLSRLEVPLEEVVAANWSRESTPPRWAVLEPSALPSGEPLRPWTEALTDYGPELRRAAGRPVGVAGR